MSSNVIRQYKCWKNSRLYGQHDEVYQSRHKYTALEQIN